jgi:hypothetical protein
MEVDAPRASQPSPVIGHRQERSHLNEITWAHTGRMAADRISDKTSMKVKRRVGLGSEKSIVTFDRFLIISVDLNGILLIQSTVQVGSVTIHEPR